MSNIGLHIIGNFQNVNILCSRVRCSKGGPYDHGRIESSFEILELRVLGRCVLRPTAQYIGLRATILQTFMLENKNASED